LFYIFLNIRKKVDVQSYFDDPAEIILKIVVINMLLLMELAS